MTGQGRSPTRVIAHRGASGHLPEHTLASKCLAYGLGADFLEQDIVATRDGVAVVLHDLHLDDVSDVAVKFPGRQRADGRYYAIDFDLNELRMLELAERRDPGTRQPRFAGRFSGGISGLRIVSLAEELSLIRSLNRTIGRDVGIYPEIKAPAWHGAKNVDLSAIVLRELEAFGYVSSDQRIFLQCFDQTELERVRDELGCRLPLVQLLEAPEAEVLRDDKAAVRHLGRFATGVGLPFDVLLDPDHRDRPRSNGLRETLADAGLEVHPYTVRADVPMPGSYDAKRLLQFLIHELRVEAVFCDQPEVAVAVRADQSC